MKVRSKNFIAIILIFLLGALLQKKYINEFPSHIHAWAQSDRYALALGFVNNDLNFFKPETFVLNHQFPYYWEVPSEESTTAVDFPIHDYIPAIFMKLFNIKDAWIFRLYILLYSFLGLYFLFKLALLLTKDFYKALFILLFTSTSPVFVYYQSGFLPSIPSLANTIIGLYFYTLFLKGNKNNYFLLTIGFLTLATLSRTTHAIFLLSILGVEFIKVLRGNYSVKSKLIPVLISLCLILSFYFYNISLRNQYGSIFLYHFLPVKDIEQVLEVVRNIYNNSLFSYFSFLHYVVLFCLFIGSILLMLLGRIKKDQLVHKVTLLIGIMFLGCLLFAILMLEQFIAHDYYFLDTFFIPIVLTLTILISLFPVISNRIVRKIISILILVSLGVPFTLNAYHFQRDRHTTYHWDTTASTINNYRGSAAFLDSLGIAKNAKILALPSFAPNIPFILMERKGYILHTTNKKFIEEILEWDYDYISVQNDFFISDIYSFYPEILKKIEKVGDNGKISICKRSNLPNQSLEDFIGISNKVPIFSSMISFDALKDSRHWENIHTTTKHSYSGNNSGFLEEKTDYGISFKTNSLNAITERSCLLLLSSYFFREKIGDCEIVVSMKVGEENTYYKSTNLNGLLNNENEWEKIDLVFQLPKPIENDYELAVYMWNSGNTELYYDDFKVELY